MTTVGQYDHVGVVALNVVELHREECVEGVGHPVDETSPLLLVGGEVSERLVEGAVPGPLYLVVVEPHAAVGPVVRQHGLGGLFGRLEHHHGVVLLEDLPVGGDGVSVVDDRLGVRTHESVLSGSTWEC